MKTCFARWYDNDVVEFVYRGRVTPTDLAAMVNEYEALAAEGKATTHLVDTLAVQSVPADLGPRVGQILEDFKERGGSEVIMVADDRINAMLGRSMSFGSGVALKVFPSRAAAVEYLRIAKSQVSSA